jgi:hypothetical protein
MYWMYAGSRQVLRGGRARFTEPNIWPLFQFLPTNAMLCARLGVTVGATEPFRRSVSVSGSH